MRITAKSALLFVLWSTASAQSPAPARVFEVASIRLHPPPINRMAMFSTSGTSLTAEAFSVIELVLYAYDLKGFQVSSSQDSSFDLYQTMYDIQAKAEGEGIPTKDEFRAMMRDLLADRFQLKFHMEKKEQPVYTLVVGKNGSKLKESSPDSVFSGHHGVNGRNSQIDLVHAPADEIVRAIRESGLDRPVLDRTGLKGTYDVRLTYTPEFRINSGVELGDVSVVDAVQTQLGLKLEPQKAMIEILVVDHVEKPTGN